MSELITRQDDPRACSACHKFHYGHCRDQSIAISTRMAAGSWIDGDRIPDYRSREISLNFIVEVESLEMERYAALAREAQKDSALLVAQRFGESQRLLKEQNVARWIEAQEKLAAIEVNLIRITGQPQAITDNIAHLEAELADAREREKRLREEVTHLQWCRDALEGAMNPEDCGQAYRDAALAKENMPHE